MNWEDIFDKIFGAAILTFLIILVLGAAMILVIVATEYFKGNIRL